VAAVLVAIFQISTVNCWSYGLHSEMTRGRGPAIQQCQSTACRVSG